MGTKAEFISFLFGCNTFFYRETRKNGRTKKYNSLWKLRKKIKKDKTYKQYISNIEKITYSFTNWGNGTTHGIRTDIFGKLRERYELIESCILEITNKGVVFKYDIEWDGYYQHTVSFDEFKQIRLELETNQLEGKQC